MSTNHTTRIRALEARIKPTCPACAGQRMKVNTVHCGPADGDDPVPSDTRCLACNRIIEALTIVIRRLPRASAGVHADG